VPYAACDACRRIYLVDREVAAHAGAPAVACPGCAAHLRAAKHDEALACLATLQPPPRPASSPAGRSGGMQT